QQLSRHSPGRDVEPRRYARKCPRARPPLRRGPAALGLLFRRGVLGLVRPARRPRPASRRGHCTPGERRGPASCMTPRMPRGGNVPISAAKFLPTELSLPSLQIAAQGCRGCPIYENATQTVFGEGVASARIVLVGEQPGNDEDLAG